MEVRDNELLAIVGPSGCGKTTTLRLMAGLESATSGRILFDEQVVTDLPPVKRDVAMVFQSHALFPHLTAFDNLAVGLKLRHLAKSEINSRVHEAAQWLGITHCLNRKPGQLSGGERQRVALGRAVVRRPKILLLDEPLSHLDEPLRLQMRGELRTLHDRLNLTSIYVTHDQAEALSLGDRVAVVSAGKLQQVGAPLEIYETPANAFVAGFIGSPPMNLFQGTITQREAGYLFLGTDKQPGPPVVVESGDWRKDWFSRNVGRQVLLGVRPEALRVATQSRSGAPEVLAVVQSIEFSGMRTVLQVHAHGHRLAACVASDAAIRPGQTITLTFDLNHARLYDAVTGSLLL